VTSKPEANQSRLDKNEVWWGIAGLAVVGLVLYYGLALLHFLPFLKESLVDGLQFWVTAVLVALGALGMILEHVDKLKAHRATQKIQTELKTRALGGAQTLAATSPSEIVASLGKTNMDEKHLERLVEQVKQQLLADDEYFHSEIGNLIVDYLQPLPRNAKRVLNRLRVNMLIAFRRNLFTTEPRVTVQQIGKWLVLNERWPQLGQVLTAVPHRIAELESAVEREVPLSPKPSTAYRRCIKSLEPIYAGDEELRRFLHSDPALSAVLPRLVHFGSMDKQDP
jgi:hypothetical protein